MDLKGIVADFSKRLQSIIDSEATRRARATVLSAFGGHARRGPGRPPKNALAAPKVTKLGRLRKKAPLQLCPVPGCKNPAAPVFGMVCSKHKDLPKAKIKKFRAARKAKKLGLKPANATKGPSKETRRRRKSATGAKLTANAATAAAAS